MGLSAIGPVMQFAYVPTDFDAAVRYWTQTMGVGPFFLIENVHLGEMRYLGEPTDCMFSIAIGYWGDMQIELVRVENDAPGIYRGQYGVNGDVMHHQCVLTDDIVKARAICAEAGAKVLIEGNVGADGAVIYVDTGGGPGTILEILQPASGTDGAFAMMRDAAKNWDGTNPLRKMG